jgi:hypothetical protein
VAVTWLREPTVEALREALRGAAPGLAGGTIVARGLEPPEVDPEWCGASAVVGGRFVVKFAWAEPPALRICHEARLMRVLGEAVPGLPLPTVVAASSDPALLVTLRSDAVPFFGVRHLMTPEDRPRVADDLAAALVALHDPEVPARVGPLPEVPVPARPEVGALVRPVAAYERRSGTTLDVDRIMAWHLRTVLADVSWRAAAGVPLPDHRTPAQWVDDLGARLAR